MGYLEKVRTPEKCGSLKKERWIMAGVFMLGIGLGVFSKFLDYRQAELPVLFRWMDSALDLHNFLGTFAPWMVLAVFISIKSSSPLRAGINVFVFFTGMVAGYYLYSYFIAGFFPKSYAMIWGGFTLISPALAFLCWYAKGRGWFALVISAGILGFIMTSTLSYGMWYIDIRSWLHFIMLVLGVMMLRRSLKETIRLLALAVPMAVLLDVLIPFGL